MANFKTHSTAAAIVSGIATSVLLQAEFLQDEDALLCWALGIGGGVLPDIDSDNKHCLNILFTILSTVATGGIMFFLVQKWPMVLVWVSCVIIYLVIHYGIRKVFEKFTVHRGVFHSVLAGAVFTIITAILAKLYGRDVVTSWFFAAFVALGYFVHLILDEVFKVNFMNEGIEKPFGSALKLWDYHNTPVSLVMGGFVAALVYIAPPIESFFDILTNRETYQSLVQNMLP